MNQDFERLFEDAMRLPERERSDLAARLIESLDEPFEDQQAVDAAWIEEIGRRVAELDAGKVASVPWPEARWRILGLKDDSAAA